MSVRQERERPRRLRRLPRVFDRYPRYFLTLCTEKRVRMLDNRHTHDRLVDFLRGSPPRYGWHCGAYVVMPDHIHLLCGSQHAAVQLGQWIKGLKAFVGGRSAGQEVKWQRGFFDHVLRSSESFSEKWQYIRDNPVRAGLVDNAEEWPYSGQIDDLTM